MPRGPVGGCWQHHLPFTASALRSSKREGSIGIQSVTRVDIPDFAVEGGSGEERHCHMEGGVLRWGRSGKGGAGGGVGQGDLDPR